LRVGNRMNRRPFFEQALQVFEHLCRILIPLGGVFGHALGHHQIHIGRYSHVELRWWRWFAVYDLVEDCRNVITVERSLIGQQLVENHGQRENIGAIIHLSAGDLLWRHVEGGAHELARSGQVGGGDSGHTEIGDDHPAVRVQNQICRFDVPVDNTFAMGKTESIGYLLHHGDCFVWREDAAFIQHLP